MEHTLPIINSVWSSYGHTFMDTGSYEYGDEMVPTGIYVSCLTCGAEYVLRPTPEGTSDGAYEASNGDEPVECSRITNLFHGYEDEPDDCVPAITAIGCNCIACDS